MLFRSAAAACTSTTATAASSRAATPDCGAASDTTEFSPHGPLPLRRACRGQPEASSDRPTAVARWFHRPHSLRQQPIRQTVRCLNRPRSRNLRQDPALPAVRRRPTRRTAARLRLVPSCRRRRTAGLRNTHTPVSETGRIRHRSARSATALPKYPLETGRRLLQQADAAPARRSHYDTQRTRNAGTAPSGAPPQRKNRRRRIALRDLSVTFAVWSAFWTTK